MAGSAELRRVSLSGRNLPEALARHLLEHHSGLLPDLSGLTILVPNHRAGQDLAACLARAASLPALIPPHITPLKSWAQQHAAREPEPHARRLARLHGVLRLQTWLGEVDRWALADELLSLADEISAARFGDDLSARLRILNGASPDSETHLIEAVWRAMNSSGSDPQASYAEALEQLLQQASAAHALSPQTQEEADATPKPVYGYALGTLTALEQNFLQRMAQNQPVTLFELAAQGNATPVLHTLSAAWLESGAPLIERAAGLASTYTNSPVQDSIRTNPAPHLEAEAAGIASWVAEQLQAGRRRIALIALDRETARRTRALLERVEVLVADETGWTLSTTAAAAVIDRWLDCLAQDFPHAELLDLLKSPFVLHQTPNRQDAVLALEAALRKKGVAQGLADIQKLAHEIDRHEIREMLNESASGMKRKAHGAERPRYISEIGEEASTALRSDSPAQPFGQRFLSQGETETHTPPKPSRFAFLDTLARAAQHFTQTRAPLFTWLDRLLASLDAIDASVPLGADAAGSEVLRTLLQLRAELGEDRETYHFNEWRRWLNLSLESATFIDRHIDSPIVLTSLPNARGRVFDAVALIGADAAHLPAPARTGLFSQSTRAQLGLTIAQDSATQTTRDLLQLLSQGAALLSWQAWHNDEPNPASAYVLRLQALHQAAWGKALDTQAIHQPPSRPEGEIQPTCQPAPVVLAQHLPLCYSPTAYQTLLDCPYRFFVHHVLGLRKLDEADDPLDKSDYGNALHRILKTFHDSQPPQEYTAALALLAKISAEEFDAFPAYTAAAWQSKWHKIQPAYIEAWLAWIAQGWQYQSGEHDFSVAHSVPGLGEITLHGRIDRVDQNTSGALTVIDYKTTAASDLRKKLKAPEEAVQLPFYAWLADAAAAFLPINETPVTQLMLDGKTDIEAISLRLPALLEAIATGTPLTANGIDTACKHCEARGLCRKGWWGESIA